MKNKIQEHHVIEKIKINKDALKKCKGFEETSDEEADTIIDTLANISFLTLKSFNNGQFKV
ncbi:MAG: hypothetical protein M3Q58_00275 [Bacteroidota bacterium]|nr:hypothetical protein [Bacteroidota bacterium]